MRKIILALLCGVSWFSISHAAARPALVSSADGVAIACEVQGQGEPASVLVHGWSCDRGCWKDQLPLAAQYRVNAALVSSVKGFDKRKEQGK